MWVSPFRHLRIIGYLLLPEAFRSLSRLSSALGAKASALCSFLLGLSDAIALTSDGLLVFFLSLLSQCLVFVSILRLTYHQEMNVLHMRFSRYSHSKAFLPCLFFSVCALLPLFLTDVLSAIRKHNPLCPLITGKTSYPNSVSPLM